jgi:hypothetical protein
MINDGYASAIAGTLSREIATTNQRTPNIPQTNYFLNAVAYEVASGEGPADGWENIGIYTQQNSSEFGWQTAVVPAIKLFKQHSADICYGYMDIETARKYRHYGSTTQHVSTVMLITTHAITFTVDGQITSSNGGTVDITAVDSVRGIKVGSTSRTGNGSYSITVYDNVNNHYAEAYESATYLGRSANGTPNGSA